MITKLVRAGKIDLERVPEQYPANPEFQGMEDFETKSYLGVPSNIRSHDSIECAQYEFFRYHTKRHSRYNNRDPCG